MPATSGLINEKHVLHLPNSIITITGSQLDHGEGWFCDGWSGDNSSPTDDGWKLYIRYYPIHENDGVRLNDGHVYFYTDVGSGQGLYCPMSNHQFGFVGGDYPILYLHSVFVCLCVV